MPIQELVRLDLPHILTPLPGPRAAELIRRDLPERVRWWSDVLRNVARGISQVLSTFATPWNIANYPKIAETLIDTVDKVATRKSESRSNKQQAVQFLGRLERPIKTYNA